MFQGSEGRTKLTKCNFLMEFDALVLDGSSPVKEKREIKYAICMLKPKSLSISLYLILSLTLSGLTFHLKEDYFEDFSSSKKVFWNQDAFQAHHSLILSMCDVIIPKLHKAKFFQAAEPYSFLYPQTDIFAGHLQNGFEAMGFYDILYRDASCYIVLCRSSHFC